MFTYNCLLLLKIRSCFDRGTNSGKLNSLCSSILFQHPPQLRVHVWLDPEVVQGGDEGQKEGLPGGHQQVWRGPDARPEEDHGRMKTGKIRINREIRIKSKNYFFCASLGKEIMMEILMFWYWFEWFELQIKFLENQKLVVPN